MSSLNIATRVRDHRRRFPDRVALITPQGKLTFRQLDEVSDAYARGFEKMGITRGTKTILMVKVGPELFTIVFALFKLGAIPVVVDPGMGIKRMLHCYRTVGAEGFIGIPLAQWVRIFYPKTFASLKSIITVGRRSLCGARPLPVRTEQSSEPFPIAATRADELLMINFTTGSTGPAKGVEYTHGMADQMIRQVIDQYHQSLDSVTLATLPLFGIFDLLIGSTSILPEMDPTKSSQVDPRKMVETIRSFQVTHMFASPAFLYRIGEYAGKKESVRLPSLRQVIAGGAPVSIFVLESIRKLLSETAVIHATYGATEALPIASISYSAASSLLSSEYRSMSESGKGTCVGMPLEGAEVRIIRISDGPFPKWSDLLQVQAGEIGEITIAGPTVSQRYHGFPEANALMKITEGDRIWHRTGDLGWMDEKGRIWFCGRKSQRVITSGGLLHTVQWEGVFNAHSDVYRSALVGFGPVASQKPVICIELRARSNESTRQRIEAELRELASKNILTQAVHAILFHRSFPVDIRHNAKIDRDTLARWAELQLRGRSSAFGVSGSRRWLMLVPSAGWIFILYGIVCPLDGLLLKVTWWTDVILSIGAHGLQLFAALPAGRMAGFTRSASVLYTFLFGATWWKSLQVEGKSSHHFGRKGS